MAILLWWFILFATRKRLVTRGREIASHEILKNAVGQIPKQSRANPRVDAAMKLLLPGAPDPEQVTPRGALRSMQRYRLHLGF
jgi:hypothetical protein